MTSELLPCLTPEQSQELMRLAKGWAIAAELFGVARCNYASAGVIEGESCREWERSFRNYLSALAAQPSSQARTEGMDLYAKRLAEIRGNVNAVVGKYGLVSTAEAYHILKHDVPWLLEQLDDWMDAARSEARRVNELTAALAAQPSPAAAIGEPALRKLAAKRIEELEGALRAMLREYEGVYDMAEKPNAPAHQSEAAKLACQLAREVLGND